MAGSYNHLKSGWSMIENMGDANECVEELYWLVEKAIGRKEANRILDEEYYPMIRSEKPWDEHLRYVKKQMCK